MKHAHSNPRRPCCGFNRREAGEDSTREDRPGLYRSRHGRILGVCRGIADYFGVRPIMVRFIFFMAMIFSGFWPAVGLYLLAALLMKPAPVLDPQDHGESSFYDAYAKSPSNAMSALKERFERLERRIRRLEDAAVSRERDWDRRFHEGR